MISAVLFDRDDTLVRDVPYCGNPSQISMMPGAVAAVRAAREAGARVGLVSNQSGIGRGLITHSQARAVNQRVADVVGGLDVVLYCPHVPAAGCHCRKPRPGMVIEAARRLGVPPSQCGLIGDIGADMQAARAAGARSVMVPTPRTRREEVAGAVCAHDVLTAVRVLLGPYPSPERTSSSSASGPMPSSLSLPPP